MDKVSLQEIGLTPGEVKVYLALLKLGSTKTGPLAIEASVSSSKVYKILARLETKGLASHTLQGKITYFRALEPKRLLDYIDEEEKRLAEKRTAVKNLLPALEKYALGKTKTQVTLYTGFKAISNFFRNILDDLSPGEEYYVLGAKYGLETPEVFRFFQKYHQLRAEKKIKLHMLANNEVRNTLVPSTHRNADIRFLPEYLMSEMQIIFYKNKVFIIIWGSGPVGFLMESEEAAKSFKKYFDAFWKIAKK